MTILIAVKKNNKVFIGADRITTFGGEYTTELVCSSKIVKLKHAYLATSGYTILDNIIEHLYEHNHKMMESEFENRTQVFQFFLDLYSEMKKSYTLNDIGKDTYAGIYNVFLLVTPTSIYGISNNLSVHEYDKYAVRGAGSDYSLGTLYALYDLMDNGQELCRIALEAACHFSIYCKEPLDILEVKKSDFGTLTAGGYKSHGKSLLTLKERSGLANFSIVQSRKLRNEISKQSEIQAAHNGTGSAAKKNIESKNKKKTSSKALTSKKKSTASTKSKSAGPKKANKTSSASKRKSTANTTAKKKTK